MSDAKHTVKQGSDKVEIVEEHMQEVDEALERKKKDVSLEELQKLLEEFPWENLNPNEMIEWTNHFEERFEVFVAVEKNKQKAKEVDMWKAHQETIDKLVELKFKHGALLSRLRKLRNDFPSPELVYNKRYQTEVIKNPQVFASLSWKWKKRLDAQLGEADEK